ncbi:MAG: right-handed parallel beta-helix repeat-containing protein [Lachnospiraceae bacterium]|nr:right-handed parallel beta-helix repeat-containing protein [Lachnospiraceae bacterium]
MIQWKNENLLAENETEEETETESETEAESETETVSEMENETESETETETEMSASLTYEGGDYAVTVSYGSDAQLPDGVELIVSEYAVDSETWQARYAEAAELYSLETFRLFNIGLYAEEEEVEPAAAVNVAITFAGALAGTGDLSEADAMEAASVSVIHFAEATGSGKTGTGETESDETGSGEIENEEAGIEESRSEATQNGVTGSEESGNESIEILDAVVEYSNDGQTVTFTSDSFSDYGIAVVSDENETDLATLQDLINLAAAATEDVTLTTATTDSSGEETTTKTAILTAATDSSEAVITLYADFTENLEIPSGTTVTIDLRGHTLSPAKNGSAITVNGTLTLIGANTVAENGASEGARVTVTEGEGSLANTDETLTSVRGVDVAKGGSFTLINATITGFSVTGNGGGVFVENGGAFAMNGGIIRDNAASGYGGGLFIYDASSGISILKSAVCGNTASKGGGIAFASFTLDTDGTTITDLSVTDNTSAGTGGGIYSAATDSVMAYLSYCTVSANTAGANGGGIYFASKSTVTLAYCMANDNLVEADGIRCGGGICIGATSDTSSTGCVFTMIGGSVSRNTIHSTDSSNTYGGGLFVGGYAAVDMTDVTVDGNTGANKGGGIDIYGNEADCTLTDLTVTNNTGIYSSGTSTTQNGDGGGLRTGSSSRGTVTVNGGTYANNYCDGFGGGMYIYSTGIIKGNVQIYGNSATSSGAGVFCRYLTIETDDDEEIVIYGNTCSSSGGGVCAYCSLQMSGNVSVHDNTGSSGAGIYIALSSSTSPIGNISGNVEIYSNTSSGNGAGIYASSYLTELVLSGSVSIHDNTVTGANYQGGGVYVTNALSISDEVEIYDNAAGSSGSGGGVYVSGGAFTMTDGRIYGNTSGSNGGGVYLGGSATHVISGGAIYNNISKYGGGIYASSNTADLEITGDVEIYGNTATATSYGGGGILTKCSTTIDGGSIHDNTAANCGGGIYIVCQGSQELTVEIKAKADADADGKTAMIYDNVSQTANGGNDIYMAAQSSNSYGVVTMNLDAATGFTDGNRSGTSWYHENGTETDPYITTSISVASDTADRASGKQDAYTFVYNSEKIAWIENTDQEGGTYFGSVQAAVDYIEAYYSKYGELPADTTITMLADSREDVVVGDGSTVVTATLDLNGCILRAKSGSVITVNGGSSLTICDSSSSEDGDGTDESGQITGGSGTSINSVTCGGGLCVLGSVTLESGTITDNTADCGAGVYVAASGSFTMTGGSIAGNSTDSDGQGGGVYLAGSGAEFMMSGGSITENSASYGGGVSIAGGTFTMSGDAEISANTASGNGGGVYLTDGTAAVSGNAIITENTATGDGGGIYAAGGTFAVSESAEINANTASGNGGGAYVGSGATFSMDGGIFTENSATDGGGIYVADSDAALTAASGFLYANTASSGSANDVYLAANSKSVLFAVSDMSMTDTYDSWYDMNGDGSEEYPYYRTDALDNSESGKEHDYALTATLSESDGGYVAYIPLSDGETAESTGVTTIYAVQQTDESGEVYYDYTETAPEGTEQEGVTSGEAVKSASGHFYTTVQAAVNAAGKDGIGTTIYLLCDHAEKVNVSTSSEITVDLNGYTLSTEGSYVFYMTGAAVGRRLTILDQSTAYAMGSPAVTLDVFHNPETGAIGTLTPADGNSADFPRAVNMGNVMAASADNTGSLTIDGVTITGFGDSSMTASESASYAGGAITAGYGNCVILTGYTVIEGNDASIGGAISMNVKQNSSYPVYLTIEDDVVISGNSAYLGGAIWFYNGVSASGSDVVTIGKASIEENSASGQYGGAYIYVNTGRTVFSGTVFSNNTAVKNYGGAYIEFSSTGTGNNAEVTDVTVTGNRVTNGTGGGLYFYKGSVVVSGGTFSENYSRANGSVVALGLNTVASSSSISETTFTENSTVRGSMIYINASTVTLSGVIVEQNTGANYNAAGVYIYGNCTITLKDGCEIKDNQTSGIYKNGNNGTLTLTDTEISGNSFYGIYSNGKLNVEKGTVISGNGDSGIYAGSGTVTMEDGEISGNTAVRGAGIYANGTVTVNISGGTITGNEATGTSTTSNSLTTYYGGGGIFAKGTSATAMATVNISGGTITGNSGNYGGGISANHYSKVTVTGGTVTGNTAAVYGGGVYLASNTATLTLGTVSEDDDGAETVSYDGCSGMLYGNSAGLGQDVYALYSSSYANTYLYLIDAETMMSSSNYEGIGWYNESTMITTTDTIVYAPVKRAYPLTLDFTSKTTVAVVWCTDLDGTDTAGYQEFTSVQDAFDAILADEKAGTGLYCTSEITSPEVILVDDVKESVEVSSGTTAILNLNGYTLTGFSTAIECYGTLTIKDVQYTDTDDTASEYYNANYSALVSINQSLHADSEGTTTKTGAGKDETDTGYTGTITGTASTNGGGIYVHSGGNVTMVSGQIANCTAGGSNTGTAYGGAGVYIEGGTFTLTGTASINNCSTNAYGAAVYLTTAAGSFIMSGGTISDNTAVGGAVYVANGTFKMTGGEITGNTATSYGGGVYVGSSGKVTATGGEITGNTAAQRGGGIYMGGTVNLSGVTVSDNTVTAALSSTQTTGSGGGIYVAGGTLTIKTGTKITGNTASRGGGIFQSSGTITMSGGQITGNMADYGGGVAQYSSGSGTFKLSGGVLCDNTSNYTVGNDVYSTTDSGTVGTGSSKVTLIRAATMSESGYEEDYNVWRDDTYSGDEESGSYIGDGLYVTETVSSYNGVRLTAAKYGETEEEETETSSLSVKEIIIDDSNNGIVDGTSVWDSDGAVTAYETGETTNETWSATGNVTKNPLAKMWTAGSDANAGNGLVRSFDRVTYYCAANTQGVDVEDTEDRVKLYVQVEIPLSNDQAELVYVNGLDSYELTESDDGEAQILTGYIEVKEMTGYTPFAIAVDVKAMKNGELVKPVFTSWIEENSENKETPATFTPAAVTVSATGKYNVTLEKNSTLNYTGYFDMTTGQETTKSEYENNNDDGHIIYGTMLGYGVTLSLWNDATNKGMKGVEIPEGELSFDFSLKSTITLNALDDSGDDDDGTDSSDADSISVAPYIWAYKANENTDTGSNLSGTIKNANMNWNDEDDLTSTTQYAYDGAPYNTCGISSTSSYLTCYSGGSWSASGSNPESETAESTTVTFTVSGYTIDSTFETSYPTRMSDNNTYSNFNNKYTRAFSAGYIQVIVPVNDILTADVDEGTYVSIEVAALVSDLALTAGNGGVVNQLVESDLESITAWYASEGSDAYKDHATNEVKYSDNYVSETTGLYLFSEGDEVLIKANYFRNSTDSANLPSTRSNGNGSALLGSTVYVGSYLQFGSSRIDASTMQDEQEITNQVEYNYLTAINVLQKFDSNAYTPVGTSEAIVDQKYSLTGTSNYITESSTSERIFRITTTESATDWDGYTNKTMSYTLTILYAAKPDGSAWKYATDSAGYQSPVGDMDNYNEEDLIYFRTLDELYSCFGYDDDGNPKGVCVGILYEFRDCCIRNDRTIDIVAKMNVTDDYDAVGNTYCITNDVLGWTTYRPTYKAALEAGTLDKILYDFSWSDVTYASQNGTTAYGTGGGPVPESYTTAKKNYVEVDGYTYDGAARKTNYLTDYIKTEYSGGYMLSTTHLSGWYYGNTLLIYTLDSDISIDVTDKASKDSNDTKYYYNINNGEWTANFKVTPSIGLDTSVSNDIVLNGETAVNVTVSITLPEYLSYNDGTLVFDYSKSDYEEGELDWAVVYVKNSDGTSTITLTTTIYDPDKELPSFSYCATIGTPGDSASIQSILNKTLTTKAEIYIAYESEGEEEKIGGVTKYDTAGIVPTGSAQDYIWVEAEGKQELGEDLVFNLNYNYAEGSYNTVEIGTLLPYNGDGRGTSFTGAYKVSRITLTFTDEESYKAYIGSYESTDPATSTTGKLLYYSEILSFESDNTGEITNLTDIMSSLSGGTAFSASPITGTGTDESENTVYTVTYSLTEEEQTALTQLSTKSGGSGLYVYLPSVVQNDTVTISVTLQPATTSTAGYVSLLEDSVDESVQAGGNIYYENMFYRQYSSVSGTTYNSYLSNSAYITIVERKLSGRAWLDQDRNGAYSTVSGSTDRAMQGIEVYLYTDTAPIENDVVTKETEADGSAVWSQSLSTTTTDENGTTTTKTKTLSIGTVTLENVYTSSGTGEMVTLYPAQDVLGNLVAPVQTSSTGLYTFENLAAGNYYVVFKDSDGSYTVAANGSSEAEDTPIAFSKLSVTTTAKASLSGPYNKSLPDYDTSSTSGITPLEQAYASKLISDDSRGTTTITANAIELPEISEISGNTYTTSNWNAGFYYIELNLEKVWENIISGIEEGTAVTFEVTGTMTDDSGSEPDATVVVDDKYTLTQGSSSTNVSVSKNNTKVTSPTVTVTDDIATDGTVTWTLGTVALQAKDASGEISYSITESAVKTVNENGTTTTQDLSGFVTTVETEDNSTSSSTISVTATNTQVLYELVLYKISTSSGGQISYLSNATFTLYTDSGCTTEVPSTEISAGSASATSGANALSTATSAESETGKLYIGKIAAGTYYLKESAVPSGYTLNQSVWKIVISYNKNDPTTPVITVTLVKDENGNDVSNQTPFTLDTTSTTGGTDTYYLASDSSSAVNGTCTLYTLSFQMKNVVTYSLPATGSVGIVWPTLAGIALMLAALVMNERKRWGANA